MIKVSLYTKAACSLCDVVKAELATLEPTFPHRLEEIDITQDDALFAQYRYAIPVLNIANGAETVKLKAPITRADLLQVFRQISNDR